MLYCPNKNLESWKNMERRLGVSAFYYYHTNGGRALTDEQIDKVLEKKLEKDTKVDYQFKAIDKMMNNLATLQKLWKKVVDKNLFWDKVQKDFQIPKEQLFLLKTSEGNTLEEKIINFYNNFSYTVEIKTAKKGFKLTETDNSEEFIIRGVVYRHDYIEDKYYKEKILSSTYKAEEITSEEYDRVKRENIGAYSNKYEGMTVPGGTNYREQEIATPNIIPTIKGHAEFATDKGIGWFRSDEQITFDSGISEKEEAYYNPDTDEMVIQDSDRTILSGKTRRILEVQSDLFQKGRNRDILVENKKFQIGKDFYGISDDEGRVSENSKYYKNRDEISKEEFEKLEKTHGSPNLFLQLLNKDNNWVTFFVKSIIQDSAKKGYEKVLFPTGNTASKVERHTTLEEFKKQKEDRIKELENKKEDVLSGKYGGEYFSVQEYDASIGEDFTVYKKQLIDIEGGNEYIDVTKEEYEKGVKEAEKKELNRLDREINQLKQELERVETEGFGVLKPIYNFYENTITNILKKQGYNPVLITDEYGNTWNEITLTEENADTILFNEKQLEEGYTSYSTSIRSDYFPDGDTTNLKNILSKIAEKNHTISPLAKYLMGLVEDNISVTLKPVNVFKALNTRNGDVDGSAFYDSFNNSIELGEFAIPQRLLEYTIVHEAIHALSLYYMRNQSNNSESVKYFDLLYSYVRNYYTLNNLDYKNEYALSNIDEFLTGVFTKPDFIKRIIDIPALNKENLKSFLEQKRNVLSTLERQLVENPSKETRLAISEVRREIKLAKEFMDKPLPNKKHMFQQLWDFILSVLKINRGTRLYEQAYNVGLTIMDEYKEYIQRMDAAELEYEQMKMDDFIPSKAIGVTPKELGLYKKEISGQQTINVKKNVEAFNKKNGRSIFVEFKRMGQSDLYTWTITDKANNQTKAVFSQRADKTEGELESMLLAFLDRFGITTKTHERLKLKGVDVSGFADILNKIINITKDADPSVLTEEVVHFAVELLGDEHPYVKRLMSLITEHPIYEQVKKEYAGLYTTEEEFKKEAIGKLITETLLSNYTNPTESKVKTFVRAFYNSFVKVVNQITGNKFYKSELDFLSKQVSESIITNSLKQGKQIPNNITSLAHKLPENEVEALKEMAATLGNRLNQLSRQSKLDYATERVRRDNIAAINDMMKKTDDESLLRAINIFDNQVRYDTYQYLGDERMKGLISQIEDGTADVALTSDMMNNLHTFVTNYRQAVHDIGTFLSRDRSKYQKEIEILNKIDNELKQIQMAYDRWEKTVLTNIMYDITKDYEVTKDPTQRDAEIQKMISNFYDEQTKDSSWWRTYMGSLRASSNPTIRYIVNKINKYLFLVEEDIQKTAEDILPLYQKLADKGFDMKKLIVELPSGKLGIVSKYDWGKYLTEKRRFEEDLAIQLGYEKYSDVDTDTLSNSQYELYQHRWNNWHNKNSMYAGGYVPAINLYKNKDYDSLVADEDVKLFLDKMMEIRTRDLMKLPTRYWMLLEKETDTVYVKPEVLYELPQVSKQFIDVWVEKSGLKQYVKDKFVRTTDEDVKYGKSDNTVVDYFGNEIKFVPVNYVHPVANPSKDILFTTLAFTEMASNHMYMNQASGDAEFMLRIIGKSRFRTGSKQKPQVGTESNIYKTLKNFIDAHIYGETDKAIEVEVSGKTYDLTKFFDRLSSFTRKLNLSGAGFTMLSNMVKSNADTIVEGVVGKNFSTQTLYSAKAEVARHLPQIMLEAKSGKQNNVLHKILMDNVVFDNIKNKYKSMDRNKFERATLSDTFWYAGYEAIEYKKTAEIAVSIMKDYKFYEGRFHNTRQLLKKGLTQDEISKLDSYYDNYTTDGKVLKTKHPIHPDDKYNINTKIKWLVDLVDGRVSHIDKNIAHRNAIFSLLLTHRNWFISGVDKRFKASGFNPATEEWEVGYYRAFGKFVYNIFQKEESKLQGFLGSWNTLSEEEKIGVYKVVTDLALMAVIVAFFALAHGLDDDETSNQMIAYLSSRILLEHSSFLVPTEMIEMVKSPFAAASTLIRIQDLFIYMFNSEEVERGVYDGLTKREKALIKLLPKIKQFWEIPGAKDKDKFLLNSALKPFNAVFVD